MPDYKAQVENLINSYLDPEASRSDIPQNLGFSSQNQSDFVRNFYENRQKLTDNGMNELDAEMSLVNSMTDAQIQSLPISVKYDLISTLSVPISAEEHYERQTCTSNKVGLDDETSCSSIMNEQEQRRQDVANVLTRVHKLTEPSAAFQLWDFEKRRELASTIMCDPILSDARSRWNIPEGQEGHMPLEERQNLIEYYQDIQAQIYQGGNNYGISVPPVIYDDTQEVSNATYGPLSGDIRVSNAGLMNNDFESVLETMSHEHMHYIQDRITDSLRTGEIKPDDPIFYDALIFRENSSFTSGYLSLQDYGHSMYSRNPLESHAQDAGGHISYFAGILSLTEEQQSWRIEALSDIDAYIDDFTQQLNRENNFVLDQNPMHFGGGQTSELIQKL